MFEEQVPQRSFVAAFRNLMVNNLTGRQEHDCIREMALQLMTSAHPTHTSASLEGYVLKRMKQKCLVVMDINYTGGWTVKGMRARVSMRLDANTKQIDSLEFSDLDNSWNADERNLNQWKQETNSALDRVR